MDVGLACSGVGCAVCVDVVQPGPGCWVDQSALAPDLTRGLSWVLGRGCGGVKRTSLIQKDKGETCRLLGVCLLWSVETGCMRRRTMTMMRLNGRGM